MGKLAVLLILGTAFVMGAGLWYAQTRGYYAVVEGPVTLTLETEDGLVTLPSTGVEAVASSSSPLGFRACFAHELDPSTLATTLAALPRPDAVPTIAPPWFDCFEAEAIGAAIDAGAARPFTAYKNVAYGVDRIVALTTDGRGYAWHELNECGRKSYDGTPVGEACPDRDTFEPLTEGSL